jgi:protein O-GlcNAc transferase
MWMPDSFLCYLPDGESPEVGALPAVSSGCITFGSFNNFAKVSSSIIGFWIRILRKVPDSKLIIKAESLADRMTRDGTMNIFYQQSVDPKRVELLAWVPSVKEHLETYNRVDIGLDTFPYNGTTTTCEAL